MIRVNANVFRQAILLWPLIVLPSIALADAEHDAKKAPVTMEGMDHSDVQGRTSVAEGRTPGAANSQGDMAAMHGHWMAPEEAAKRPNPVKANNASRARGKKLFAANCASCHGRAARGDGPAGAALNPKPADLATMAGQHPDGDFAWKIAEGRGAMPAWKKVLKDEQIWDLVNYIQGLAKPKKNHPSGDGHQHNHQH
mgnify:CR=1 FL=1